MKAKPYSRVSAVLRANGWQFIRAVGSHRNFHKPKVGTLKSIARQSGIPESEF